MAKIKVSKWDVVDCLKTDEDIRAYLEVAAETGDTKTIARAIGDVARVRNMSKVARDAKVSRQGLIKALSDDGNPTLDTVGRVLSTFGLRLAFTPTQKPKKTKKAA